MNKISKLALGYCVNQLQYIVKGVDASRITMQQVRIRRMESVWVIESTDGHRWVTNEVDGTEVETEIKGELCFDLVALDDLKLIQKRLNKYMLDGDMVDVGELLKPCVSYPDTESLRGNGNGYDYQISFKAEYLETMLKAMRTNKRTEIVRLSIKGPTDPIRVTCDGASFGVLMPCRDSNSWGLSEESGKSVAV